MQARTQLKYAVEVQIPQSTPMLGLLEPLLEKVVFEDLPQNLAALKARMEQLHSQGDGNDDVGAPLHTVYGQYPTVQIA